MSPIPASPVEPDPAPEPEATAPPRRRRRVLTFPTALACLLAFRDVPYPDEATDDPAR